MPDDVSTSRRPPYLRLVVDNGPVPKRARGEMLALELDRAEQAAEDARAAEKPRRSKVAAHWRALLVQAWGFDAHERVMSLDDEATRLAVADELAEQGWCVDMIAHRVWRPGKPSTWFSTTTILARLAKAASMRRARADDEHGQGDGTHGGAA
jgi:hypothetical protein